MLGKLLKYDFKATWLYLSILYVVMFGYTVVLKLMGFRSLSNEITGIFSVFLIIGYVFLIIGVYIFTYILVVQRFYKNMFSAEGYLTNTLPVKASAHLCSKAIMGVVWLIITEVLITACIWILTAGFDSDILSYIGTAFAKIISDLPLGTRLLYVFLLVINTVQSVVILYTAACVGQLFSKRRVLASILIYLGYNMASGTFTSLATAILTRVSDSSGNLELVFSLVYSLALTIGGFVLSNYILKKHLNLE